jgi:hypothetical protein
MHDHLPSKTRSPAVENEVTNRLPYDNANQHALWNRKKFTAILPMFRRVIVAHAEAPVGESMSLLLGLKGFPSIYAQDLCSTRRLLDEWGAQALLLDTRLDIATHADRFIVALSSIYPEDSMPALQAAGFDGHCQRPCPIWRLTDLLSEYFDRAPYP